MRIVNKAEWHDPSERIPCPDCDISVSRKKLGSHQVKVHGALSYRCGICEALLGKNMLGRHICGERKRRDATGTSIRTLRGGGGPGTGRRR
jgi:hypothetical protein